MTNPKTLEQLKAELDAAQAVYDATRPYDRDAPAALAVAADAYYAAKYAQENSND